MASPLDLPVAEQAARVADPRDPLRAADLVDASLRRIEALDGRLHACLHVDAEGARRAAASASRMASAAGVGSPARSARAGRRLACTRRPAAPAAIHVTTATAITIAVAPATPRLSSADPATRSPTA